MMPSPVSGQGQFQKREGLADMNTLSIGPYCLPVGTNFSLAQAVLVSLKVLVKHAFRALRCSRCGGPSIFPAASV